jgi:hypothetical protein
MKFVPIQYHPNYKQIFNLLNLIASKNLSTEEIINILSEFENKGSKVEPNYQGNYSNKKGNHNYGNSYGPMGNYRIQNHNFKEINTNKSQFNVLRKLYYK